MGLAAMGLAVGRIEAIGLGERLGSGVELGVGKLGLGVTGLGVTGLGATGLADGDTNRGSGANAFCNPLPAQPPTRSNGNHSPIHKPKERITEPVIPEESPLYHKPGIGEVGIGE
jgi:hypothetical protein